MHLALSTTHFFVECFRSPFCIDGAQKLRGFVPQSEKLCNQTPQLYLPIHIVYMYKPKTKGCNGGRLCDKHKECLQFYMRKYVASSLKANVNILVLSNLWEEVQGHFDQITCFKCVKIFWRTKYYNTIGTFVIQWAINKWPFILNFSQKKNHKWTKSQQGMLNKTLIQNEENSEYVYKMQSEKTITTIKLVVIND